MKINGDTYFSGAYYQRLNQNRVQLSDADIEKRDAKVAAAFEEMGFKVLPAAELSLSDEAKRLLFHDGMEKTKHDMEEIFQKQREARIQEYGEDDVFAIKGNDQWLVFSEFLYNNRFYDNMSDEAVKNTEQVLMEITDGMDDVFSWGHQVGMDLYDQILGEQLDSNGARVEMESSIAALRYFSENLLDKANKESFNELIDKYYKHNSDVLNNGYASIEEKFNLGRSRLPDATKERLETERLKHPADVRNEQAAQDLKFRDILGSITHSEEEINNYILDISDLFATINQENNFDNILNSVRERFLIFVTNKSDNNDLKGYVLKRSEDMFMNINNYWTKLIKLAETTG